MKKTYVYFLVPLLGLIIFGAVYWNFNAGYEAKEAAKKAAIQQAKREKLEKEARDREIAIKDALAAQEKRKQEKAAKEAKDRADKEARLAAIDARDKANRDQARLQGQMERLQKDVKTEQEAIAKLQADKEESVKQYNFLKDYVKQAQANTKKLYQVVEKIAAADAAKAAADAAAAKAAKNS
jgi:colicin import membrane protein